MSQWINDEVQAALAEVCRRSSVNLGFRDLALSDTAAAILGVSGKTAPAGLALRFVDNSGPGRVVPLRDPVIDSEELSEAEVAGIADASDIGGDGDD